MAEEIASLFVTISADVSGLDRALQSTRANLEALQAQGGLLGRLPQQTEQQAAQIVAGVQRALAPLPAVLRGSLEAPINNVLFNLSASVSARINAIIDSINAAISRIQGMMASIPTVGGGGGGQALPGRASGGSVVSGQPYLIGERGPEIFQPGTSGSIIPNHAIGGSGVNITGTINVYGVQDANSLFDQLQQIASQRG